MRPIGFSTGAISKGDFHFAVQRLRDNGLDVVELSALRFAELPPLLAALPKLDLATFKFISIHAPSRFERGLEQVVARELIEHAQELPVVVHPDVIFNPSVWAALGSRLLIENMDKRKPIGRTLPELEQLFRELSEARFCFDLGHARQVDPSMTEAVLMLREFGDRLAEVHVSEVNTSSRHDPISTSALRAFKSVANYIPESVPIVIESLIDEGQSHIRREVESARESLTAVLPAVAIA
ncbi:MAG: hypothetical protein M3Y72_20655 [Acidobacteriota bacterium]|nr:hypothetical protein [Acidobacteriota bacterium]